jgi:hypothetical protein
MTSKAVSGSSLPRYERGQLVRVRSAFSNRHSAQYGVVVETILSNDGNRTLDKYVIQFADKDQDEFWGIQLES